MATKRSLAALRSPRAFDLAIAAVLLGWNLAAGVGEPLPGVLGVVLMCAPIAVRRSWPLPATAAVGAGFVIGALQDDPPETLATLVTLLVAYALLGNATPDRRQAIAGAGIAILCGVANTALVVVPRQVVERRGPPRRLELLRFRPRRRPSWLIVRRS